MSAILAGISAGLAATKLLGSFLQGSQSAAATKKALELQKKQWALDLHNAYVDATDALSAIRTSLDDTMIGISQTKADIASSEAWLSRYDDYYALNMQQLTAEGMSQMQGVRQGWQNQLTLSAAQGLTGGTSRLLSAMQRQNAVNLLGADLTLDSEGGYFGAEMTERQRDLAAEKETATNNLTVLNQALEQNTEAARDYLTSLMDALGSAAALGHYEGMSYDALSSLVDQYKEYFGAETDEEYQKMREKLLADYKPIGFDLEYIQKIQSHETLGDNGSVDTYGGYAVIDKNTGKYATAEQIRTLLKEYGIEGSITTGTYNKGSNNQDQWLIKDLTAYIDFKTYKKLLKASGYDKLKDNK